MAQCRSQHRGIRCQGRTGHKDMCWFYDRVGNLIQWVRRSRRRLMGSGGCACSYTPTDHHNWIHPRSQLPFSPVFEIFR